MDILSLLDELQTIARNGLNYASDPYDRERYRRLLNLSAVHYEALLGIPAADVRQRFAAELGHITPKVGGDAAIFDDEGRILLVKRADDGRWCLPCGWLEPNESPVEAAVRETREETGLHVRPLALVDVFTRKANIGHGPHTAIAVVYLCEITGGVLQGSHEGSEVQYWRLEDVPDWHELHQQYATAAYGVWQERDGRS
jgi:ADP-ribose pyrophosphatase YjhB (NUDIX family)